MTYELEPDIVPTDVEAAAHFDGFDPDADFDPLWCVVLDGFDPDQERVREALMALADGRVGVGGATLAGHPGERRWTVAGGVYQGEGAETHLLSGPVGFHLPYRIEPGAALRRVLDLRTGVLWEHAVADAGPVQALRFSSIARPGLSVMRARCPDSRTGPLLRPSTDGAVAEEGVDGEVAWMSAAGASGLTGGMVAAAHEVRTADGQGTVADRVVAYEGHGERLPVPDVAVCRAREAAATGFADLLAEHRQAWTSRWEDADIRIEGDDALQLATRFAMYHLMSSVPEEGEAAVGARGLTGEGYRGHVFWDADTFTLPFLAATRPAAARAMLEYRLRRLPAAQAIARANGRAGARFPWESARSGADVTPSSARDRTGRLVPIRTGLLEEHIAAQVAWAACFYTDWTGDEEFACGPGLRLLVETARYWRSRIRMGRDGTGHIYGVIGPDEYHEPVDDNAFTNVMARWNLRTAADAVEVAPTGAQDVDVAEIAGWREAADALVDGFDPHTGVYEQFAGFNRLESLLIAEVAPRRPIAADLLLGARRVHGAQVLKQADVLMLHHLIPDHVAPGTLAANLRFYEPRTAHGSSLSPPIHASLFARVGDHDRALDALRIAARMDLDDLTETTASGLHLATMGGLWQAFAFGFAGLRANADRLHVDPHHPPAWSGLEVRVTYRGSHVRVRTEPSLLTIHADPPAAVSVGSAPYTAGPAGLQFSARGPNWEVIT
ncbi:MAG: glycosyl hydrolase family 65 protein [Acidimicrobiia bacterium]